MELVPIFVNRETARGLYSFQFGKGKDEFRRLLSLWSDTFYVMEYCEKNKEYLLTEHFKEFSIQDIISRILKEAEILRWLLLKYSDFNKYGHRLQHIFKPLNDNEITLYVHQESKVSLKKRKRLAPILRLYAIRISENTYVISGGAIKLVHKMKDHHDLRLENKKLQKVKNFLIDNGFDTEEDLKIRV